MDTNKLGEAHGKAVAIIDKYAKSHNGAALMLGTLCQAEIDMLGGTPPAKALWGFTEPLASRLLKVYAGL